MAASAVASAEGHDEVIKGVARSSTARLNFLTHISCCSCLIADLAWDCTFAKMLAAYVEASEYVYCSPVGVRDKRAGRMGVAKVSVAEC